MTRSQETQLIVACVKVGHLYDARYVNILYDAVKKHLTLPFKFVCLTDDPRGLDKHIHLIAVPLSLKGWWAKLYLFAEVFTSGDKVLYLDLDTIITGSLDDLAKVEADFAILRDVYRPDGLQSSIMCWRAGVHDIFTWWNTLDRPTPKDGDQIIIEKYFEHYRDLCILQYLLPRQLRSYRLECMKSVPDDTRIVFFHGYPKPHHIAGGWVPTLWKRQ